MPFPLFVKTESFIVILLQLIQTKTPAFADALNTLSEIFCK